MGTAFKQGFKQGMAIRQDHPEIPIPTNSVFIRLLSDLSIGSVKAKIAGELKDRTENGSFSAILSIPENYIHGHMRNYGILLGEKIARPPDCSSGRVRLAVITQLPWPAIIYPFLGILSSGKNK